MRDGTLYWIWLAQKLGAGNRYLPYLMERYSDAFEVYRADSEELFDTEMPEALQEALSDKNLDEALAISDYCTRLRIGILTYKSELYPAGLRRLKDPPTVLYYRGRMPDLSKMVSISVVGTRTMSEYGKSAGYKIAYELASAGVCIVSGMALGVDSVAACAALAAGNTTIAVLGSGVDVIYPKEHATLYKKIIERGAVISEYPPTTRPEGRNFPQRNRIISGLGMGTIVIEGDMRSGALITAECALEQGKDLFALPGNIDSANASGTNALLRNGADLVLEASDVLNRYSLYHANKLDFANLTRAKARSSVSDEVLLRYGVHLDAGREEKTEPVRRAPVKRDEAPKQSEKLENIAESSAHIKEPAVTDTKVLDQLPEKYRDIFGAIPDGRPVSFDEVLAVCKTPGEAMSALTFLEIKGAVSSLPGGYYLKN
ncbi:MAG: DNA-processing protein DprA [Clostridia bacterium]|nr:DNA-processing protein DprA [Clostridia bacterium]